ncbi:PhzF family phenazine biosynthesis protein [Bradyrhizobium sp. i1.7.7]
MTEVELVNVFTHTGRGGNPCPIVIDASNLTAAGMQSVARRFGHESGFVLPAPSGDADYAFRFWVPRHEMEMCGHATIGALWVLATKGRLPGEQVRIETRSGSVTGYVDRVDSGEPSVEISQPVGKVVDLSRAEEEDVLSTLKLSRRDLLDMPVQNAVTSRVKTLIPIKGVRELNELVPDPARIEACCGRIGSTGLLPLRHRTSGRTALRGATVSAVIRLPGRCCHRHCRRGARVRTAQERPGRAQQRADHHHAGPGDGVVVRDPGAARLRRQPACGVPAWRLRHARGATCLAALAGRRRDGALDLGLQRCSQKIDHGANAGQHAAPGRKLGPFLFWDTPGGNISGYLARSTNLSCANALSPESSGSFSAALETAR